MKNKLVIRSGVIVGQPRRMVNARHGNPSEVTKFHMIANAHGIDVTSFPAVMLVMDELELSDVTLKHVIVVTLKNEIHYFAFSTEEDLNEWHLLGKYYGYPDCCIDSFVRGLHHYHEWERGLDGSGYISCEECSNISLQA